MNSVDTIRFHMQKVAAKREVAKQQQQHKSHKQSAQRVDQQEDRQFVSLESKVLAAFHASSSMSNMLTISKYIMSEVAACKTVIVLRILKGEQSFRLYARGTTALESFESYKMSDFECIQEVVAARAPLLHNDESEKMLTKLCQWKPLFGVIPDMVVAIPIFCLNDHLSAVIAISFKNKLPKEFFEKKVPVLRDTLDVLVPYAVMTQAHTDDDDALNGYSVVLDAIEKVEKVVGTNPELALSQIGLEVANLGGCKNFTIFVVEEGDNLLRKYHTSFGHPGRATCPNKKIHALSEIPMSGDLVAGLTWVAKHKKGMRINNVSDYADFNISARQIHSIGNCNTRALLITPVVDYSGESALVIELAERDKVLNLKDFELVLLFCQHTACLLTCTVLLDRRERNFRRRNIINEMLCSIHFVKRSTVEQFITHHRKTSNVFRGLFDEFNLCIRCFPEQDIAGIALEIFYELDIVKDFKIRRSILIRFIMSVQQGYGPLPYHNWYHAVSVAHFAYLLIRKLKLIEQGHLDKLEAFALIVSALTHDIDHRGTNNQFQSYTNSDIYKLYATEDSVMERHHLSIALAILHREDCNILESFNDVDYKNFVELLTWNIIATDIAKHMKIRDKLFADAKSSNSKKRKMARLSLFMTAADLCDNCKRWDDNLPTVKGILQEFFNQGDMERQLGFQPIPMMDRDVAYIPAIEYKFVKFIVTPVYKFLAELYEELLPCMHSIQKAEELWTLAIVVFDQFKNDYEQLDIFDLHQMKENELMKINLDEPIEKLRQRKFFPPPPITAPAPAVTSTTTQPSTKPVVQPVPAIRSSRRTLKFADDELEEVDTGEKRAQRWYRFCCCCCNDQRK